MSAAKEQQEHAVKRASKIFAVIKQASERGEPCPTNDILAERFSCGTTVIVNALHFLEANGMIRVERYRSERIVTILATGQRTAGVARAKPHWSTRKAA